MGDYVTHPPLGDNQSDAVADSRLHSPLVDTRVTDLYEALADVTLHEAHFDDRLPESSLIAKELSMPISAHRIQYSRPNRKFFRNPPLGFTPVIRISAEVYIPYSGLR